MGIPVHDFPFGYALGLRWPLLPSTSPAEPAFQARNYWRGPVWPVITWLLWRSEAGEPLAQFEKAEQQRKILFHRQLAQRLP